MDYLRLFEQAAREQFHTVEIDGLGKIRLKKYTAADVLAKERFFLDNEKKGVEPMNLAMFEVCRAVVDDDGKPFLKREQVQSLPERVVLAVWEEINRINSPITADAADKTAKKS